LGNFFIADKKKGITQPARLVISLWGFSSK